jgi:hypothetical protein
MAIVAALCSLPALAQTDAAARPAPRLTQPIDNRMLVTLKGAVHPLANPRNDRGPVPPDTQMPRVQLVLKRSPEQESTLRQLIEQMHTPGSPQFHKWLTPEQFGKQFGPADEDIATIKSWLEKQGFQVGALNPGKQTLDISGTVGQLQAAFHTTMHKYLVNGQIHFANSNDPQIPSALAPVLGGFVSLNNFHVRNYSRFLGSAQYDPKTGRAIPEWTLPSGNSLGNDYAVAPADFATQYDLTPLSSASPPVNGSGQTIAVINDSNINLNRVGDFRSLFGLPSNLPQVIVDGNDPGIDGNNNPDGPNDDSGEAYLDVEWSGAIAPQATIDLVIAGDTSSSSGLYLAMERAVYSNLAPVMSISFGSCEYNLGSNNSFLSGLFEQAAAQGITVLVASGDSGSAACDNPDTETVAVNGLAVSGFASTRFNVAVGGTDFLYSNVGDVANYWSQSNTASYGSLQKVVPEQPWNDSPANSLNLLQYSSGSISAGGGGPSTCGNPTTNSSGSVVSCAPHSKPSWQTGAGVPNDSVRDLPDVALFAGNGLNGSFYAVCAGDGDCASGSSTPQISGFGGTSVATPTMAAIMALINQKYGPQGQADYEIYALAAKQPSAFHDITQGGNAVACQAGSQNCGANNVLTGYSAGPGFDLASGWGSVDANVLVTDWNSRSNGTATTTTLTPSPTSFTHGASVTFSGSVTGSSGTPTGDVALMTDSPLVSNQSEGFFTLSGGSIPSGSAIAYLPGGTYNVWGVYSGDGTFAPSTSAKTQITVTPEASDLSLAVTSQSSSGASNLAGQQVPYGTLVYLDATPESASYYQCQQSGASNCTSGTAATGSVSFSDSGAPLNTVLLNTIGVAEFDTGSLKMGAHSIAAKYAGDPSYNGSTAPAISFTVIAGQTQVSVSTPVSTIAQGQAITVTALVQGAGSGLSPTGTVTFKAGATSLGTGTLSSVDTSYGVATLTIQNVTLPVGTVSLTANYAGDSNYAAGTTATPASLTVTGPSSLAPSTTSATASSTTETPGARINVTATVTGQPGRPAPTGTVDIQAAGVDLTPGGIALSPGSGDSSTVSYFFDNSNAYLLQGSNPLVFTYSGDSVYAVSEYNLLLTNPQSDFSMVSLNPTVTVTAGSSVTAALNFGSINGFSGSVALTCAAPANLSCSVSPATVTVNGANVESTVTITASSTAAAAPARLAWFAASGSATLACLFLFGLPSRRRRWSSFVALMAIAILAAGMGCGKGSSPATSTTGSTTGTTTGSTGSSVATNNTVVVTGTSSNPAITHDFAISVVVNPAP